MRPPTSIECPVCDEQLGLRIQDRKLQVVDETHVFQVSLTAQAVAHLRSHRDDEVDA